MLWKFVKIDENLRKPPKISEHLRELAKISETVGKPGKNQGNYVKIREIPRKSTKFHENPQGIF